MQQGNNPRRQGDQALIITDKLIIDGGKIVPSTETQAGAIADATAITGGESPTEAEFNALQTKVNSVLAALRGVGIIASS